MKSKRTSNISIWERKRLVLYNKNSVFGNNMHVPEKGKDNFAVCVLMPKRYCSDFCRASEKNGMQTQERKIMIQGGVYRAFAIR